MSAVGLCYLSIAYLDFGYTTLNSGTYSGIIVWEELERTYREF